MTDSRAALTGAAGERVAALVPKEQERWQELWDDAASDFQRACLEAALLAGNGLPILHAFADAIRAMSDGEIAGACRPAAGETDQDPLRAFRQSGHPLTPHEPQRVPPPEPPPQPLLDLTGGVGPRRYGNVLDVSDEPLGIPLGTLRDPASMPREFGAGRPSLAADLFNGAAAPFGIRYEERLVSSGSADLARALTDASTALEAGIPVPVLLGGDRPGTWRYALLLQTQGAGARRAFQLHDPFANETVWVNHRDLEGGNELPFEDRSLKRITALALPR